MENTFSKESVIFRIYSDFEAVIEKDNFFIGNKTTDIYKQNPVLNGYHIKSEREDVLKSEYYKSPLGYDSVDWLVNEVINLENEMNFYFKIIKKYIVKTEKDEEVYRNFNICRFCEKNVDCDKIRDHCHLTGNYRGPAHSICKIIVTQDQSNFTPFLFHRFCN